MHLLLDPDLQKLIEEQISSGGYESPGDVVRAALTALKQQEQFGDFVPGELDQLLAEGEASIEQEGTLDGAEAFEARRLRRAALRSKAG